MKRPFDIVASLLGIVLLSPLMLFIAIWVKAGSAGPVFFRQVRVGKNGKHFRIWKFRTMASDAEQSGQITTGTDDPRVTRAGYFLRKYKLDEIPQLINVLSGQMSIVGPRPEVPAYVRLYNQEQQQVLSVRPGITDYASLEYANESRVLEQYPDPEIAYREVVMPAKLQLNLKYIREQGFFTDIKIILQTLMKIFR